MIIMDPPHLDGYEWDVKIGGGSFSSVYKAFIKAPEKQPVAVKCISRRGKKVNPDAAIKEIALMKRLKHDNIVKLIDFQFDSKYIYIIMEFCNEGDLSKLLKEKYKLAESFVQILMQQLCLALKYLRQHNICHMDLKPQNILLTRSSKLELKLGDFGLSQILSKDNIEESRFAGSFKYMAPEKLLNQTFDARVDLWSVGIIMFECLFGRTPFGQLTRKLTLESMSQKIAITIPPSISISSCCEDLLFKLLKYDPNERSTFEDFFSHEFLKLNYLPCSENYDRVKKIIEEGSAFEKDKKYIEALQKYNEGICFLEGFSISEPDADKKHVINQRLYEYKKWVKHIKGCIENANQKRKMPTAIVSDLKLLSEAFKGTPQVNTGLDIGSMAEMYLAEGNTVVALDKLTAALEILLPLLSNEPAGNRKDMLHKQIEKWLTLAEVFKEGHS